MMFHIQDFYRNEMWRHGLGKRSFNLDTRPDGELVIHDVVGESDWQDYRKSDGERIKKDCVPVLMQKGILLHQETVMIFTNLVKAVPLITDSEYGRISLGKHNSIFIGGIAHELGHALGLPHCRGNGDEISDGTALISTGNHTYFEELRNEGAGTFLSRAHALRLASHPQFSNSI